MSSSSAPAWPGSPPPPRSPTPGERVLLLDQEPEQSLGGQAFWSLGGLFLVDSPEQRRMGIKDSPRPGALQDWMGSAQFDREEDRWPRRWAEAYVDFAAGEKRSWLREMGHRIFPVVGWAERGDGRADGHGNSVPALPHHLGHRPGRRRAVRAAGARARRERPASASRSGTASTTWSIEGGTVTGVRGTVLEPDARSSAARRQQPRRGRRLRARRAGRDRHQRRHRRQPRPGPQGLAGSGSARRRSSWSPASPRTSTAGCSASPRSAGAEVINPDRMWHYVEGLRNWDPIWDNHGIRILPGPSSLWLDATGKRLPGAVLPGLRHPRHARATCARPATTTRGSCSPRRSSRRSSRSRAPSRTPTSPARTSSCCSARVEGRRARAGRGVQGARRGLRRRRHPHRAGARDERDRRTEPADRSEADCCAQLIEARDREIDNRFTKDAQVTVHPRRPQLPRRQADPGRVARTRSSTRRTAR